MHRLSACLLPLIVLPALAGPAHAAHKDDRLGFSIQTPREWSAVALNVDERWVVGKYLAEKSSFYTDKATGWTAEHKAEMQMIAFVTDAMKEKVRVTEKEGKGGKATIVEILNPYKDYKDFLTKRYTGGGWFVDKESQEKVGDVAVTVYDIRVEKSSSDGPKRITTWIYHHADMDLAVQFECLEGTYAKLQNELQRCFRSYKPIKRSGEAIAEASTGVGMIIKFSDLEKMTPEDRKRERQIQEKNAHDRATKTAPKEWTVKRMGRFLTISHADERFTKNVVERCEALWKWMDATFAFVGEKEYVRVPIVRVCKNFDECRSFYQGMTEDWTNIELVTYDDQAGKLGPAMRMVCEQMVQHWFFDRDPELSFGMPTWITSGLTYLLGNSAVKQEKLELKDVTWIHDYLRQAVREEKVVTARMLLTTGDEKFWDEDTNMVQSCALLAYVLSGDGSKDRRTKDLFANYLKNLQAVLSELAAERVKEAKDGAKEKKEIETEEEEDAAVKERGQKYKAEQKKILDMTFERTFKDWTSDDWKAFEAAFLKTID